MRMNPADLFSVSGRSILITGASGALGSAVARYLAAAGANLLLASGNQPKLDELAGALRAAGGRVETWAGRIHEEADADRLIGAALAAYGRLDGVVEAAGVNKVSPIVDFPVEDWDAVMQANLRATWLLCRSAGRLLLEQGSGGKVVLTSSTRGKLGHPAGYSAYCPSKGAIDQLVRTLACEWGKDGICVNGIGPTVFRSDLTAWMYEEEGRGRTVREAMLARIPLGRLGEPEDFVGAVGFLLSPASDFCTGQILYVDGGYTAG